MAKEQASVGVVVEFGWHRLGQVQRASDGRLLFPSTGYVPSVYRFRLLDNGPERHYLGEASELRQRFQQYRTPGSTQQTNLRLNGLFRDHLEGGGRIDVDIAADGVDVGSGGRPVPADLSDAAMRKLLESAALVACKAGGLATLNR